MSTLIRTISRFRRDRSGNIAVTFGLAVLPLVVAVGCAIDYSRANQIRSKLISAADAASVGSIAKASPGFIGAGAMTSDGEISAGEADATKIFNGNIFNQNGFTLTSVTPTMTKTGGVITSTVKFTADVPTMFLGVIGQSKMTVTGASTSTANMPLYIDFYLLLDNSPSMGVAATPTDVTKMVNNTSDQCAFACHDYNNANNYYNLAKTLGVTTRIDVLRSATQQLMDTAANTATYASQYRMAIYDFGASSKTIGLRALFSLSTSLSSAKSAAGNIDLMGVYGNNDAYTADKDSQFSTVLPAISNAISAPGPGTAAAPMKYLFFVSDGVADEPNSSCLKPISGGNRCQSPINPALCTAIKNRGIKIAVLYTTYLQLPTNSWYMTWIDPFNQGPFGPSPNSQIAQNMQACASPGFYFEVSPTQGIADAMNALFKKAVADARISS
ncbi:MULTISPECIES: TadE/TadG family type IV pilus assembly protein [Bradyrhizobium]|uniref:Flp pilus assembly protein TadG n=1 Tax=Bradyrhizobium elkanii TaxID=29448 RepID=A0A8I2C2R0_BRAEL|nr:MULTISPECIES: TadE/TadG family type IV pilus assembly protein [Bradyrhizobium]MBP1292749.1 Flp pilus assembly protein TadG [Bradyrhizobium elkanii]MCP1926747.1 Flp pilus assembly protein TadG [Bradyrhizobium elkanii]MCS3475729.1 Flp pilus assembly protein TadG [Bradyrhizobium elkanii]MCS3582577.1 Flp pilus assembly protein TadG [Bradyrhizobium elkanii]MCS3716143.1 Flp pilus assembly protein TadG [Bradyrhizobium elkanii]